MSESVLNSSSAPLALPDIIERYRAGESLRSIAPETSVKVRQLYNWLYAELGPEFKGMQRQLRVNRIADSDWALDTAKDALQLARAREQCKFSRFDLERLDSAFFGPKQEVKTDTTITVIVQRQTPQPVVVEPLTIEGAVLSTQNNESTTG